jgi:hypothetical protein
MLNQLWVLDENIPQKQECPQKRKGRKKTAKESA